MKHIVMIEDQEIISTIYRKRFTAAGFAFDVASDGEQGLAMIIEQAPDLVLLDWSLPKLSGHEVLRKVRAIPQFHTMPIIVFSMSSLAPMIEAAQNAGASLVLCKSDYGPADVIEFVRELLVTA